MKKVLFAVLLLGLVASVNAGTTPLLVEAYQEGTINIPIDETDTVTVAEVSFSVDSSSYVLITVGGMARLVKVWLELDGDSLPPAVRIANTFYYAPISIAYCHILEQGEHTIAFQLTNNLNSSYSTICSDAYLQALIFLPDSSAAVAERPIGDAEPLPNTPSVLSSGPYVNVAGASELVDATGRVIENAISEDKVFISNLPTGTYFARDGERTVVKIVKVD